MTFKSILLHHLRSNVLNITTQIVIAFVVVVAVVVVVVVLVLVVVVVVVVVVMVAAAAAAVAVVVVVVVDDLFRNENIQSIENIQSSDIETAYFVPG